MKRKNAVVPTNVLRQRGTLNLRERRRSVPYTQELLRYHCGGGFEKTDKNWT